MNFEGWGAYRLMEKTSLHKTMYNHMRKLKRKEQLAALAYRREQQRRGGGVSLHFLLRGKTSAASTRATKTGKGSRTQRTLSEQRILAGMPSLLLL